MTKNLFFLFSLYFFVIQAVIIGYLSNNTLFYKLGAINAGAIILISILYALFTKSNKSGEKVNKKEKTFPTKIIESTSIEIIEEKEQLQSIPKQEEVKKETVGISKIVQSTTPPEKKKKKKKTGFGQRIVLLLTLGASIGIYYITSEFIEYRSVLLAIVGGFLLFIILGKLADIRGFDKTSRLASMRIYLLFILLAGGYTALYFYGKEDIVEKYLNQLHFNNKPIIIQQPETINPPQTDDYIFEGTGSLITDEEIQTENPTPINNPTITPSTENNISSTETPKNVTMVDALKHIIDTNNIPLSQKTDISFTYVAKNNAAYPYFRTAYEKRMIGKTTEANKQISCDTYIVIKGIGEGWNVGSYTDIKAAYRSKAEQLDKLNNCKKGSYVTTATL